MTNTLKKDLTEKLEKFIAKRFSALKNIQFLSEAYADYLLLDPDDRPPRNSMLRLLEASFGMFEVDTLAVNHNDDGPEFLLSLSGSAGKAEYAIFCQFSLSYELVEIRSIEIVKGEVLNFEKITKADAELISSYVHRKLEHESISPQKLPDFLKN